MSAIDHHEEQQQRRQQQKREERRAPDTVRPTIGVAGRELRDVTRDAIAALQARNDPPELFRQVGRVVRVVTDELGQPSIETVDADRMRNRMTEAANFSRANKSVFPPIEVVRSVLASPLPFPHLVGIIEAPALRADGTILAEPGYDAATMLIYAPAPGLHVPKIPETPSAGDAEHARELISRVLEGFPFVDDASRAAAWALLLTPILRPAIAGPVPLAALDAPAQGTGKGLLAGVGGILATGRKPAVLTEAGEEEEWRKRITAILVSGPSIVLLDNVDRTLRSPHLAAALTCDTWSDRILRMSDTVEVPVRATWIATGNNLTVGGDLRRRVYWCRMDAKHDRPWERDGFTIPNLPEWVREHRGELVAAVLTLARAWVAAGRPKPQAPAFGGFEDWRHVVGGVLLVAGVENFLGNAAAAHVIVDVDADGWARFLAAWHRNVSEASTVGDALQIPEVGSNLPDHLDQEERGFRRKLGKAFQRIAGRRYDGMWVERAGENKRGALWQVHVTEERATRMARDADAAASAASERAPEEPAAL